jgi:hypothetical protein
MRASAAVLALVIAAFSASAALACSCVIFNSAAEQLARSDVAFRGRVIGERLDPVGGAVTSFRVVEAIKGRTARTVQVRHRVDSAACGLRFKAGSTVLVLAHRTPGERLETGLCSQPRFAVDEFRRAARGEPVPTAPPPY